MSRRLDSSRPTKNGRLLLTAIWLVVRGGGADQRRYRSTGVRQLELKKRTGERRAITICGGRRTLKEFWRADDGENLNLYLREDVRPPSRYRGKRERDAVLGLPRLVFSAKAFAIITATGGGGWLLKRASMKRKPGVYDARCAVRDCGDVSDGERRISRAYIPGSESRYVSILPAEGEALLVR